MERRHFVKSLFAGLLGVILTPFTVLGTNKSKEEFTELLENEQSDKFAKEFRALSQKATDLVVEKIKDEEQFEFNKLLSKGVVGRKETQDIVEKLRNIVGNHRIIALDVFYEDIGRRAVIREMVGGYSILSPKKLWER